jgi:hypothetical protein
MSDPAFDRYESNFNRTMRHMQGRYENETPDYSDVCEECQEEAEVNEDGLCEDCADKKDENRDLIED